MHAMNIAGSAVTAPLQSPGVDEFGCPWEEDLRSVGLDPRLPAAFRVSVSVLALVMLGGAVLAAFLAPDAGASPGPVGLVLMAAAAVPWARWAWRDDGGPSWFFAGLALAPLSALGIGWWLVDAISLGSDLAYYLMTFPALLLVMLYAAFAPVRMAAGTGITAYAGLGVPLLAAGVWGRQDVEATGVVMWHAGLVLSVVAGYAVGFGYNASMAVSAAREALARQTAAAERRRVAQDVHDVVAHTLAITMLHITAARMAVRRSSPAEAEEALEEAERHGRASLNDIRRIVRLLRSDDATAVDAAQPGLADIEALAESYRAAGLPVELSLTMDGQHTSPTAELAVYRVLQEALANAARHGSGPATVHLQVHAGEMSLHVNNPVQHQPVRPSQGSGLLGMRERIAAAGGTIEAGAQGGRWVVRASVPSGAGA
jgi:signal transduction histidine kinase